MRVTLIVLEIDSNIKCPKKQIIKNSTTFKTSYFSDTMMALDKIKQELSNRLANVCMIKQSKLVEC